MDQVDKYALARIIALLESIEAKLAQQIEDASHCPHGGTGLCMYCVIQLDLLRPKKE